VPKIGPTFTPPIPPQTAEPPTATVAPDNTETPAAKYIGYPPDTRTGISHLDAIIDAMLANDRNRVLNLIHFAQVGCTTVEGFGGPPKCRPGEVPGTLVEGVPTVGVSEGMGLRRDELGDVGCSSDCRLLAALRNVVESVQSQDWAFPAKYALVFGHTTTAGASLLLVDEEGIVGFVTAESMHSALEWVSGDFILPPVPSLAPESSQPWFSPMITFATEPIRAKAQRVFPAGTRQVFAFWTYVNMRSGLMVRRDWYRNGELWLTREEAWDFAKYGATGVISDVSVYDLEQGLEPGRYTLKLSIDDRVQDILERQGNIAFEVLKRNGSISLASPVGSRAALIDDPKELIIVDPDGTRRRLLVADEISSAAWLPDSLHLIYSNRDRSRQRLSAGTFGIRDELWIADVVSGEHHSIGTAEENLHTPVPSPDGRYVAVVSGTGWFDACLVDWTIAIVELDNTFHRTRLYRLADFKGLPANLGNDVRIYADTSQDLPAPGLWRDNSQLTVRLTWTCTTDNPAGDYVLDLATLEARKVSSLP
jgi:hypothetical protein